MPEIKWELPELVGPESNPWEWVRRWVEEGARLGLHRRVSITIAHGGVMNGSHIVCRPCEEDESVLAATDPGRPFTVDDAERVLRRALLMIEKREASRELRPRSLITLPPGVVVEPLDPNPPPVSPNVRVVRNPLPPLWFTIVMAVLAYLIGIVVGVAIALSK